MQAFVIILLGLGFTAGVVLSTTKNEQLSADELESDAKTEVVHVESTIDAIDDSQRDSILPLL